MLKSVLRISQHVRLAAYYPASAVTCAQTFTKPTTCCCVIPSRSAATNNATQYIKDLIVNGKWSVQSALKKVGIFSFSKNRLRRNGYLIYDGIVDNIDYKYFFQTFNMPDTFNSWFLVVELHVWMVLVRLMAEAEEGRFMRNMLIEAMWEDIRQKTGLLGIENVTTARAQIKLISEEFQAAILGYDEGLLNNDVILAGALWRRFFSRECNDPVLIELLIKYIRKQVKSFDSLTREDVLLNRRFMFFPFEDKKLQHMI